MTKIIERSMTPEEIEEAAIWNAGQHQRDMQSVKLQRLSAYKEESDPIFFQAQRGDTYTMEDWIAKISEINERYPYPEEPS